MAEAEQYAVVCTAIQDEAPRVIDGKHEPDGHSFIEAAEMTRACAAGLDYADIIRQVLDRYWQGGRSCRVTDTSGEYAEAGIPEGLWIEVWMKASEHEQAPFDPPLTAITRAES